MRKKHNLSPVILFFFSSTYHHHKSGNPIDCPCPIVYTTSLSLSLADTLGRRCVETVYPCRLPLYLGASSLAHGESGRMRCDFQQV